MRKRQFILGLIAAALVGCLGNGTVPVHGIVSLHDGTPAGGVTVLFEDGDNHVSASGVTDDDGSYTLTTFQLGDGAPPGTYKVAVFHPAPADSSQAEEKGLFNSRYESIETSRLTCVVGEGKTTFNITLDQP